MIMDEAVIAEAVTRRREERHPMAETSLRHYVVLKVRDEVAREYFNLDRAEADTWATSYVAEHVYGRTIKEPPFRTIDRPSADIQPSLGVSKPDHKEVVVALSVFGEGKRSSAEVVNDIMKAAAENRDVFSGSSADIPFSGTDHWCGGEAADPMFSERSAAEQLLGVDYLKNQNAVTGRGVNVIVVDQGLDQQALGARYGDGWTVGTSVPGSPPARPGSVRRSHGMMIARNILKVAPEATLFDLPLIPPRITDIPRFLSSAQAAFLRVQTDVGIWKLGRFPGPWIMVNAWSIYDRSSEHPRGNYTENAGNSFNNLVVGLVGQGIDVIFAAGNCGQFCPDGRCGALDRGPGHSIWGAASLEQVLTVGAVRADRMWLGYSSQGPGQPQ